MPVFTFEAKSPSGQTERGRREAASAADVVSSLRALGWLVLAVSAAEETEGTLDFVSLALPSHWLPPRSLDVEISLQQVAVMLRSGLTLLATLKTVAEYAQRPAMRRVWEDVAERIQQGSSLGDAM